MNYYLWTKATDFQPEEYNLKGQVRIRINKNTIISEEHTKGQRSFHNKQLETAFPAGS